MKRRILFVCRAASSESARSAQALASLENVEVVTADVSEFESLMQVADASFERIVTTQETLLEIVALANEALGLPGLSVETVRNALDKSRLKSTLKQAGINTPAYEVVANLDEAQRFARELGFPMVLKSLSGSGALATFVIHSDDDLKRVTDLGAFLAEQYINGQELCVDTITIDGEPRFHSVCCYQPSILEAVEDTQIQWSCVMPRDMTPYENFIEQGLKAVKALSVRNAMTHMEGFIDPNGRPWFTDATLRPAGARIAPMLAYAYDIDPYRAWARAAVDEAFDGPWERKYAVGTIFLRGLGSGSVRQVIGVERVQHEFGEMIAEARWPRVGARKSATYTGDGYLTIRHPDTAIVQQALRSIAQLVKITYSSDEPLATGTWGQRLEKFNELNRPAWDVSSEFNL
ncbi:MAG TPA: ATP-grasp domain-containing protein [Pyrinomonadaceae bacterium]|nr:ATP-grasp domain-containing protein [Pyrinomonadaceae bacterium]